MPGNDNLSAMEAIPSRAGGTGIGCERRLAACGIRPTAQRVRIATLLLACPQHLSAEQILAQLRSSGARVSKATVYNTLNLFAAHGLIRQLSVDGSLSLVRLECRSPHYHFHDLSTGALIDGASVPADRVQPPARASPPGTEVAGIDLVIRLRKKM